MKNYAKMKVWNIYFDENTDLIYVFLASIEVKNGAPVAMPFNINSADEAKDPADVLEALQIFQLSTV